jgi:integrase
MASLFKRPGSPYWWIKCRDCQPESPTLGQVIRYSTGYKIGVGSDTRAAKQLQAEKTLAESRFSVCSPKEAWGVWVSDYLTVYCKPATLVRYRTIWRNLSDFLAEKEIHLPRQLTRARCLEYIEWRSHPDPKNGRYRAVHNTARLELKILSLIMREAVRRDFAPFNPVTALGIKHHRPKEKPEFTDVDLDMIWQAILKEPKESQTFFRNSFLIARYQGCRLKETHLNPMTDVDINEDGTAGIIRFRIKGDREHTTALHPELIPLFQELKKARAKETYAEPSGSTRSSRKWFDFLKRHGIKKKIPGACFHSLRVSAVTRLARSRTIPESTAMRFIGHASTTVHRTYQRLRIEDLSGCLKALSPSADKYPTPETPDALSTTGTPVKDKTSARSSVPLSA